MSFLDSTIETDKEKELLGKNSSKIEDKISYLNGLDLDLAKVQGPSINYEPSDINFLRTLYQFEEKAIYSNSLSPSIIHKGVEVTTAVKVAIKELRKDKLKDDYMHNMIKNEFSIHHFMSKMCNNIVKVREYFEDEKAYYLIMEFSEEPDFFEDLLENRYCPVSDERTLKAFAFDILTGLKEIHKYNIVHCDIKPQNFLLFKNESLEMNESFSEDEYFDDYYLKITDFGFAHLIPENSDKVFMKYPCGTFAYIAPEVKKNCFVDKSIDIWSFGVCLYQMAVAYFPTAIKQYKYGKGPIPYRTCDWKGYNFDRVKDLIDKCLQIDPTQRITAVEALNHPWFDE